MISCQTTKDVYIDISYYQISSMSCPASKYFDMRFRISQVRDCPTDSTLNQKCDHLHCHFPRSIVKVRKGLYLMHFYGLTGSGQNKYVIIHITSNKLGLMLRLLLKLRYRGLVRQ